MYPKGERARHKVFTRALRGVRPGEAIEIPKRALRRLPRSYEATAVGTPALLAVEGGQGQYRGPYNRHVYETDDSWVVHRDAADPRYDPLGHLLADAPELGAGLVVGGAIGVAVGRSTYDYDLQRGADPRTATRDALVTGAIAGGISLVATYGVARLLKSIFREE